MEKEGVLGAGRFSQAGEAGGDLSSQLNTAVRS